MGAFLWTPKLRWMLGASFAMRLQRIGRSYLGTAARYPSMHSCYVLGDEPLILPEVPSALV